MATAFVLLNVETGLDAEVISGLKAIKGVKETYQLDGSYDIIARVDTETMQELKNIVSWKIRRLERVRETLTMMVM